MLPSFKEKSLNLHRVLMSALCWKATRDRQKAVSANHWNSWTAINQSYDHIIWSAVTVDMPKQIISHVQFSWSGLKALPENGEMWSTLLSNLPPLWMLCNIVRKKNDDCLRLLWCGTLQNIRSHASPASTPTPRTKTFDFVWCFSIVFARGAARNDCYANLCLCVFNIIFYNLFTKHHREAKNSRKRWKNNLKDE